MSADGWTNSTHTRKRRATAQNEGSLGAMPPNMTGSPPLVMKYKTRGGDERQWPDPPDQPSFRRNVNGILAGYSGLRHRLARTPADPCLHAHGGLSVYARIGLPIGHIPRKRDKIGSSAVGDVPMFHDDAHGIPLGQPNRYTTKQEPPANQVSFMSKDLEARHVSLHNDYKARVGGVLPGYAGFIPGGMAKYGASPYGGVAHFNSPTKEAAPEAVATPEAVAAEVAATVVGVAAPASS